jgi:outer membrane protein OmpA-like peptidoglycan-associated protein
MPTRLLWLAGLMAAVLFAGLAQADEAGSIAQAQAALEAARSNRVVRAFAALELDVAEQALERALAARAAGQASNEVEHLAYLAERRAAIARMQAKQRQIARALRSLSATHAMITQARALEAAAAARRAAVLAQRLARFDVEPYQHGLLLTPRDRWFEAGLTPAPRARRALAEAAALLLKLPEREALVLGYAARATPAAAGRGAAPTPGPDQEADRAAAIDPNDLGCVRAEVVRGFLISHGVDPRRIETTCVDPATALAAAPLPSAGPPAGLSAGETAIAILPVARAAPAQLIAGAIAPATAR